MGMRYQQQGLLRIDRSNPITRGLVIAFVPPCSIYPTARVMSRAGIGATFTTSALSLPASEYAKVDSGDRSVFAVVTAKADGAYRTVMSTGNGGTDSDRHIAINKTNANKWRVQAPVGASVISAASVTTGVETVAAVSGGGSLTGYANGAAFGTVAQSGIRPVTNYQIGGIAAAEQWTGGIYLVLHFNRALSAAEIGSLNANPWQVFEDPSEEDEPVAAAASGSDGLAYPQGVAAGSSVGVVSASAGACGFPQGVSASASVGAASASAGTSATASPSGATATGSVGAAVPSAGARSTPVGVAASAQVGAVTATAGSIAAPIGVSANAQVGTATATGGSASTAAPAGVSATASVGQPSATGGASAAPQGVTASALAGQATASAGINGIATPAGVGAAASVGAAAGSGTARCAPAGVSASALAGGVTASAGSAGTATLAGVSAAASIGPVTVSAGAGCAPVGVAAFASVGAVIAVGNIVIPATAAPLGVVAYARVGNAPATGGGMLARAPAGSGYTPQRNEHQARPVQAGSTRPAAIQRNRR